MMPKDVQSFAIVCCNTVFFPRSAPKLAAQRLWALRHVATSHPLFRPLSLRETSLRRQHDDRPVRKIVRAMAAALLLTFGAQPAVASSLDVVVTIKPIHSLVAQVMGDTGQPKLLIDGAASPYTFSLKPSDARALNNADAVFRVSETLEPFTRRILASLPETVRVVTLASSSGLTLLPMRSGDGFEEHDHEHGHDHGHKHGEAEKAKKSNGANREAQQDAIDGHIWLDPENAKVMLRVIAERLGELAPDQAATFDKNAATAITALDALQSEISRAIEPHRGKAFVVFHDAYQYFETRFAIPALGSITVSPEVQPSARRLSEIRRKIRELGAACVFAEPQFKSRLIDTVIEGTNARSGVLDPIGADVPAGPDAYARILRTLTANLTGCLGAGA